MKDREKTNGAYKHNKYASYGIFNLTFRMQQLKRGIGKSLENNKRNNEQKRLFYILFYFTLYSTIYVSPNPPFRFPIRLKIRFCIPGFPFQIASLFVRPNWDVSEES